MDSRGSDPSVAVAVNLRLASWAAAVWYDKPGETVFLPFAGLVVESRNSKQNQHRRPLDMQGIAARLCCTLQDCTPAIALKSGDNTVVHSIICLQSNKGNDQGRQRQGGRQAPTASCLACMCVSSTSDQMPQRVREPLRKVQIITLQTVLIHMSWKSVISCLAHTARVLRPSPLHQLVATPTCRRVVMTCSGSILNILPPSLSTEQ